MMQFKICYEIITLDICSILNLFRLSLMTKGSLLKGQQIDYTYTLITHNNMQYLKDGLIICFMTLLEL